MEAPPRSFLALALAIVTTAFTISSAVNYRVINDAVRTTGGQRFIHIGGPIFTQDTLEKAEEFIFKILKLPSDGNHREVKLITCIIDKNPGTRTDGSRIFIYANDLERINDDDNELRFELAGLLFHLQTRIWQSTGKGQAPPGLLSGMADYVRYAAGYEPGDGRWVKPGQGSKWNDGYDVTARFLAYCESLKSGFVAELNALMVNGYNELFFVQLLGKQGKPPTGLFMDYKAKFST